MGVLDNQLPNNNSSAIIFDKTKLQLDAFIWEPKKQNQFILAIIDGDGVAIPSYLMKATSKPSLSNGEVTLDHINVKRYVKGKTTWNTIEVTLYDALVPNGAQSVMNWLLMHHESATGRDGYSDFYKRDVVIQQLDPLGVVAESWKLRGAFVTETNFGSLDWATEDAVNITMTLRYDWADLTTPSAFNPAADTPTSGN